MSILCQNGAIAIRRMKDCPEDYTLLSNWLTNPAVLEYYEGRDKPVSLQEAIDKYRPRIRGEEDVTPCIIELEGEAIGYLQYYLTDMENLLAGGSTYQNPYGLDLFIGETEYWNRGIGTKIIQLFISYLFETEHADIVIIDPQTRNKRAIRCYEKCGFQPITVLEKNELHEGEYRDNLVMAITKETLT
ncbi:MAG: acetyltransferase [Oscillospiraceae bacterium]|nr:acetyltransferase [Oscillospiraceae bacterium]